MNQHLPEPTDTDTPSQDLKNIPFELTERQQEALKAFKDITQINTENDHEKQVALYFQNLLKGHGIDSQVIDYEGDRANLVAEIKNGEGKTLIISGHMDVVSAGDAASWTHPPFSAHIDDQGVIWGRGTSDMKSGLTALIFAFIALNESKKFNGTLRLLATVGEEVGEYGSKQLTELGYVDDADALLIGEPCNVGIIYAHKGSLNYKIISRGVAAHSSSPELGSNAIEHLNVALTLLSKRIEERAGQLENPILGRTFNSITLIKGGLQVNSVPDYAELEANARTVPEFDNQAVENEIQASIDELNKQDGFKLELAITADQPPVQANPDSALIRCVLEAVKDREALQVPALIESISKVTGEDLTPMVQSMHLEKLQPIVASGTTDAAQFTRNNKKLELAVYGPGMATLNHKIDERVPLQQYFEFIDVYTEIITRYLSQPVKR